MTANVLDFDIVIATRNRQAVLPLSLQTMLSQSRLPRHLIIVDSSDDHCNVQQLVNCAVRTLSTPIDAQIIHSEPGTSYQRNVGLAHVQSPVVFFPDDDVLWFPDFADAVMRIYEKDTEGMVGCVAPRDSPVHPREIFETNSPPYRMQFRDRASTLTRPFIRPIEQRLFLDPIHPGEMWRTIWGAKSPPPWLREEDAELCGPVSGYRMSFRTNVIRRLGGFDETLGRYALFEDSDASIGSLKENINVCAKRAKIFHYRDPGIRTSGAEFGMMAILNRVYVVSKHSARGSVARQKMKRYLYYKTFRYLLQAHSRYGRKRLQGAIYALLKANQLLDAPREKLAARYLEIRRTFRESW